MARKAFAAIAAVVIILSASSAWSASPSNTSGDHLVVNLPRLSRGPRDTIIGQYTRRACGDTWSQVPAYASYLQRRGRLSRAWRPRWDATGVLTIGGLSYPTTISGRTARARGRGSLTFAYSGWTTAEQTQIATYVTAVYPVITHIYGAPASSITVTIVRDDTITGVVGGVYYPDVNEIHLPAIQDFPSDSLVLASLIVRAFHDGLALNWEVWEGGFARAVGLIAHLQVTSSFDLRREPYYLLPVYDLLNQWPLANPTIEPSSGYTGMMSWRIGMAQAAWLKVYSENPEFFSDFNTAFYAESDPAATAQNSTRLRQLAAAAAPQVEGASFSEWFARQYVLDTAGGVGEKLYLVALPQTDNQTVYLEADYYRTKSGGNELPLDATGSFQFMLWDGDLYTPEAGTAMTIADGQGFLAPSFTSIGGAQRITVELAAGNQVAQSWFPYGVAATGDVPNAYYGVVVDGDTGSLSITPSGGQAESVSVAQGVFVVDSLDSLSFLAPTDFALTPTTGVANTRQVNAGFLYQVAVLRAYPLQSGTMTHIFSAGPRMITLPLSPDKSDAAKVLGVTATQTLLSRWSANTGAYIFYPDTPSFDAGLGYWSNLAASTTVTAHGLLPSGQYSVHLRQGWQQIGNPFRVALLPARVTVKVADAAAVTLATAQANGTLGTIYRYDTSAAAYATATTLPAYEGLWVYVYPADGCWLIFQEP